jgi:hypothetical protein
MLRKVFEKVMDCVGFVLIVCLFVFTSLVGVIVAPFGVVVKIVFYSPTDQKFLKYMATRENTWIGLEDLVPQLMEHLGISERRVYKLFRHLTFDISARYYLKDMRDTFENIDNIHHVLRAHLVYAILSHECGPFLNIDTNGSTVENYIPDDYKLRPQIENFIQNLTPHNVAIYQQRLEDSDEESPWHSAGSQMMLMPIREHRKGLIPYIQVRMRKDKGIQKPKTKKSSVFNWNPFSNPA